MKSFTVYVMMQSFKQIQVLTEKYEVSRSRVAKALITAALLDASALKKTHELLKTKDDSLMNFGDMRCFTISVMLSNFKQIDDLSKKYKVPRSRVAKVLITESLADEKVLQKAISIL